MTIYIPFERVLVCWILVGYTVQLPSSLDLHLLDLGHHHDLVSGYITSSDLGTTPRLRQECKIIKKANMSWNRMGMITFVSAVFRIL